MKDKSKVNSDTSKKGENWNVPKDVFDESASEKIGDTYTVADPLQKYVVIFNGDQARILKYEEVGPFVGKLYLTGDDYIVYELGRKMKVKFKTPEIEFIVPENGHGF